MNKNKLRVTAIILAAGQGSRMGLNITKQKALICGESVIKRSVRAFSNSDIIDSIIIVSRDDEIEWVKKELGYEFPKVSKIICGGKSRAESSAIGFFAVENSDFVAIHDAARCLVTEEIIQKVVFAAFDRGAATASHSLTDSLKTIDSSRFINNNIDRNAAVCVQTPQVFSYDIYSKALSMFERDETVTDDNMLVEKTGQKIFCVDTGRENIKITTIEDISYAEYLINRRQGMMEIRTGHGYDVHRLVDGRDLVIGGVKIPYEKGLLGHSDADVLTHAVMDAILGACGLGDIGRHFPDNKSEFKNISSLLLLDRVSQIIKSKGYSIVNIDATLVMQRPKVSCYIEEMIDNFSKILGIEQGRINIKATTEEKLGFTGREEGVSAHSVVTVKKG